MFEVEKKYDLNGKDFSSDLLKRIGIIFSDSINQVDEIFIDRSIKGFEIPSGDPVVRIRTQEDESVLTLKKWIKGSNLLEYETKIDNPKIMRCILENLNLKKVVTVNKTRLEGSIGEINVCYDDVNDLGNYLELEILVENESQVKDAQNKIDNLAKKIGLDKNDIEDKQYDTLVFEKINKNMIPGNS